jgi:hypothetical protein
MMYMWACLNKLVLGFHASNLSSLFILSGCNLFLLIILHAVPCSLMFRLVSGYRGIGSGGLIQCCILPLRACPSDINIDAIDVLCTLFQWIDLSCTHFSTFTRNNKTPWTFSSKSSIELFLAGMRTILTSYFLSNLLILYDVDSWNSKEANKIGVFFSAGLSGSFFMALLKAAEMYPLMIVLDFGFHYSNILCHVLSCYG